MMMMTDWIRCRRSFELVKCRWIWNALQPITWPGNTWFTISLHHQGMSEGIIECSTMVIPVVTALGIFLESAVVQMPRLDYSFQPENILHRVLHWKYILHDGAMHWKKAFNLCSIACQTFFFIQMIPIVHKMIPFWGENILGAPSPSKWPIKGFANERPLLDNVTFCPKHW